MVLSTSVLISFFKESKLKNYSLKKSNVSISNALKAQVFIKTYYLKFLKNVLRIIVNIFQIKMNVICSCLSIGEH